MSDQHTEPYAPDGKLESEYKRLLVTDQDKPQEGEQDRFVMRDHAIFDTKVNAFVGAGDACYLLNETRTALAAERVEREDAEKDGVTLGIAVNELREQLDAEREKVEFLYKVITQHKEAMHRLQEQLTAEREKVSAWMIHRSFATGHGDTIDDLLGELDWQITELRNQLATSEAATNECLRLLDAEREKCQPLVDALKEIADEDPMNEAAYVAGVAQAALAKVGK